VAVALAGPYANLLYLAHASTSLLSFLQARCLSCRPTNILKQWGTQSLCYFAPENPEDGKM